MTTPVRVRVAVAVASAGALTATALAAAPAAVAADPARPTVVAAAGDPAGDVVGARLGVALRRSVDLTGVRVRHTLAGTHDRVEVRLDRVDGVASTLDRRYTAVLRWATTAGATRSATLGYATATGRAWATGATKGCGPVTGRIEGRTIVVSAPRACLGNAARYDVQGVAGVAGPAGLTGRDATRWVRTAVVPPANRYTATVLDRAGDVTANPALPAASTVPAGSVDVAAVKVSAAKGSLTVTVPVADAAYWAWDPRQVYTLSWRTSGGPVSFTGVADRSGTGARWSLMSPSAPAGCAVSAATVGNRVTVTVPGVCTRGIRVSQVKVAVATTSEPATAGGASTEYGSDGTGWSPRLMFR